MTLKDVARHKDAAAVMKRFLEEAPVGDVSAEVRARVAEEA